MTVVQPTVTGYEGVEIPDGLYKVKCMRVEETIMPNDKFNKPDKFRLTLEGQTPDGEPFIVEPLMNQSWSAVPGKTPSTLYTYALAFCGNVDPNGFFDTDELLHKEAMALIETAEEEGAWPRVKSISRIKGKASAPSQKPTAPVAKGPENITLDSIAGMEISDWWAETRKQGLTREDVIARSFEMFDGAEPAQLTGEERLAVYTSLV